MPKDKLQEAVEAYSKYKSFRSAANYLGIPKSTLQDRYKAATKQGTEPIGTELSGTSTLYDEEGNVRLQWIKTKADKKAQEILFQEATEVFAAKLPRIKPIKLSKSKFNEDLMTCFNISDHHLGMLVWGEETESSDYDIKIAEELLLSAFGYLLGLSNSKYATIIFFGDYLHYDSFENVTPTNRNILDSDTRYPLMVRVALRAARIMIESAARVHEKVHVVVEIGNHDLSSSIWLMECLHSFYEDDPRITVDNHPGHYHYFQHGKCLVGIHHGHGSAAKLKDLPQIMAVDRPKEWGETEYRYFWTGHVHHDRVFDSKGCKVESFRVLPPDDAYAHNAGYRSMSDMKSVVLSKEYGEICRHSVNPTMIKSELHHGAKNEAHKA